MGLALTREEVMLLPLHMFTWGLTRGQICIVAKRV